MDALEPVGKLAARQQHHPFTLQAFQADVRAKPDDLPVSSAAGVRFAQGDDVFQMKFRQHVLIILSSLRI